MNQRIHCPNPVCPNPEHVQRVSAVVAQGKSSGHVSAQGVSGIARLQTGLSRTLDLARPYTWTLGSLMAVPLVFTCLAGPILGSLGVSGDGYSLMANMITTTACCALPFILVGGSLLFAANVQRKKWAVKWSQLYYCHSCSSVFNPNEPGRYVPAGNIQQLYK
jgi:hypothetical protein